MIMIHSVGIVGTGYFGKKIHDVLSKIADVKFFTGRDMDVTYDVDWVFIASSTESHYDVCKQFLLNGVNVFIEKPLSTSYEKAYELVQLSKKLNVKLYVDDIFMWHPTTNAVYENVESNLEFNWNKYGSFKDTIFNNLTYHDIYLALHFRNNLNPTIRMVVNRVNEKVFWIDDVKFSYNRVSTTRRKWISLNGVDYDYVNDSSTLEKMLISVLNGLVDFEKNIDTSLRVHEILDELIKFKPTVAVIGGGIFGITAALKLDGDFDVSLFEKNNDILQSASGINQYRLHRGYHYPRSLDTAVSSKHGTATFLNEYPCSVDVSNQYYAIASFGSKVTPDEYENFMRMISLEYDTAELELINADKVDKVYRVAEGIFNPNKLYDLCKLKLNSSNVEVIYNKEFSRLDELDYDYVVNATYANLNSISDKQRNYQFELCEKPIIKLPDKYKGVGVVIMDGPFTCIDPYSDSDYHVVGNVVHAIHVSNIGINPIIPDEYRLLLNRGIIKNPPITNWNKFKETISEFFVDVEEIEHIGSMFTIRTVLSDRDFDDARPSIVEKESDSKYLIFSGKISTAVDTANQIHTYIKKS